MKLAGSHPLPHPRERVWDALMDPEVLSRTLPGCERLERSGENAFAGALNVQVGPVKGAFQGTLELTDLRPPESYRMKLQGQGPQGFLTGEGEVRLEETAAGTLVHYDLDAQTGGRIAGVGQRLLESSAKVIARQGLEGLERQLAARHPAGGPAAAAPSEPAAGPAPTQAEFAGRFARGLWQELVPPRARPWVVAAALALLALLALLVARTCGG